MRFAAQCSTASKLNYSTITSQTDGQYGVGSFVLRRPHMRSTLQQTCFGARQSVTKCE